MNIFKLLRFRKILFCFLKACLVIAFNMFFLFVLVDEFISLPVLANIIWVRFIYFLLFYSILFYLFCFYLRRELNNIDKLPKIKSLKKKFLEKFKNNYKELKKKDNIKKNILIREKVIYSDFKAPNFNKQDKIFKNKFLVNINKNRQIEYREEKKVKKTIDEKEKTIKKSTISQKNKKKISKVKLVSKIFLILFFTIMYLGVIILYPGTYIFLLFILFLYFLGGIIGKILTISFVILVLAIPYILFLEDEE